MYEMDLLNACMRGTQTHPSPRGPWVGVFLSARSCTYLPPNQNGEILFLYTSQVKSSEPRSAMAEEQLQGAFICLHWETRDLCRRGRQGWPALLWNVAFELPFMAGVTDAEMSLASLRPLQMDTWVGARAGWKLELYNGGLPPLGGWL